MRSLTRASDRDISNAYYRDIEGSLLQYPAVKHFIAHIDSKAVKPGERCQHIFQKAIDL